MQHTHTQPWRNSSLEPLGIPFMLEASFPLFNVSCKHLLTLHMECLSCAHCICGLCACVCMNELVRWLDISIPAVLLIEQCFGLLVKFFFVSLRQSGKKSWIIFTECVHYSNAIRWLEFAQLNIDQLFRICHWKCEYQIGKVCYWPAGQQRRTATKHYFSDFFHAMYRAIWFICASFDSTVRFCSNLPLSQTKNVQLNQCSRSCQTHNRRRLSTQHTIIMKSHD